jgi:Zn-dependent peptidase ImmA (M78 family)
LNLNQTNIDFQALSNSFYEYVEKKMRPHIEGKNLVEWIEYIGNSYYEQYNKDFEFIELRNYFLPRRILDIKTEQNQSFESRLNPIEGGFHILLRGSNFNEKNTNRYFIAHELAHTFLFDLSYNKPKDFNIFTSGSNEIEFVCNKLTRSLLMPSSLLNKEIKKLSISSNSFDFKNIFSLNKKLLVSNSVFLNRVIMDLGIINCLYIKFKKYDDVNPWKMVEKYLPYRKWNNLKAFIPQPDKKKEINNPRKYPSVKNKLERTFKDIESKFESGTTVKLELDKTEFHRTILQSFIYYYYQNSQMIPTFINYYQNENNKMINIIIPFPN